MKEYTPRMRNHAIQLTVDNMEIVERFCNGRIRGIKLPIEDRIVQFDTLDGEKEVNVGEWVVSFRCKDGSKIYQKWLDRQFNAVFGDVSDVPY